MPRLHRVRTGRIVAPWNLPVGQVPVLGVPLRERQERIAARLGLRFDEDVDAPAGGDALWWDDDVDVSFGALRAWLRVARPGDRMALLEAPRRVGDLEVEPAVDLGQPARLVGVRLGDGQTPRLVPPRGWSGTADLRGPFEATLPWYVTARTGTTVRHWVHLLRANLAALGVEVVERLVLRPWALLASCLRDPLHPRLAVVGRGCSIHPTARLEGCVLGDGVEVGAFSVLRGCVLGDGARVEDHVTARASYVGRHGHLANFAMFNLSVLGERSSVGHIGAQASVVGARSFVSTWAVLQDLNLRQSVRVPFEGRMVDTGVPFLGVAVGDDVRLGAHVTVAPGRAIPNGVHITAEDVALGRIHGDEPPGAYTVREGRLVPR